MQTCGNYFDLLLQVGVVFIGSKKFQIAQLYLVSVAGFWMYLSISMYMYVHAVVWM